MGVVLKKTPIFRYACQVCPHFWHCVGFLSASKANKPIGKKQIATMICHAL